MKNKSSKLKSIKDLKKEKSRTNWKKLLIPDGEHSSNKSSNGTPKIGAPS